MKKVVLSVMVVFAFAKAYYAQEVTTAPYIFTDTIDLQATAVISQGVTGTCWSFSTSSFLESEILRLTGKNVDLSEMYTVRNIYPEKADNYIMRQGGAQFSEGGLAHDVLHSVTNYGLVPDAAYTGLADTKETHNHAEMVAVLHAMLDTYVDNPGRTLSKKWKEAVNKVLDVYLGENLATFNYNGKTYSPKEFAREMKVNPENYVTLTSFTYHPFYTSFILNIPDNFSNGSMYNLPLDEFISNIDHALDNGFTVTLDCDVSELTFSSKHGVAVIPSHDENKRIAVLGPELEKTISQEYRQEEFENYNTTDDHLMHITGKATDQNGTVYYKVKNSWGTDPAKTTYDGYVYMSVAYMRLKAISVLLHKEGLLKQTSRKITF
ncbi:C1 family peptidase [Dokdonia sp. 4H-3-7-5]|uniref:C1 family peptidase n=1 Tax=Dokdonia sp. (strain 4H-3-7-5) TaxID=983548 RepID=UPI00020A6A2C|nr:C1 family peptidase [Dokdonia sp. 4H-3-7-5]AEE20140.1 peptidase C1A papain [Dokdonia sp. 4H-3-7-5]